MPSSTSCRESAKRRAATSSFAQVDAAGSVNLHASFEAVLFVLGVLISGADAILAKLKVCSEVVA
jgi:hypothetical protein